MNKKILSAAVAVAMVMPGMATAAGQADMEEALRLLESQVSALKAQMAEMKEMQDESSAGLDNVSFGGVLEYEMAEGGSGTLAKVELDITAQLTDNVTGFIKLKDSTGGSSAPFIDEAAVTVDTKLAAITVTTGGHPFGDYSSNMISDPLTKTLGDTDHSSASSARIIAEAPIGENFTIAASADDDISSINANLSIGDFVIGGGHITDVVDETGNSANNLFATYSIGDISMVAEGIDNDGGEDATNFEIAYAFTVAGHDAGIAVGHAERKNVTATKEKKNMFSTTVNLYEGLDLTVEYADSDNNANDAWLAQLAYGF